MSKKYECPHCLNDFSSKSSLTTHIKRAKYCISKRDDNESNESISFFTCSGCNKHYTSKQNLAIHIEKCNKYEKQQYLALIEKYESKLQENYEEQLQEKNQQISELQGHLKSVAISAATKSTTTINTKNMNTLIQNMEILTTQHLDEQAKLLEMDHIKKGIDGYSEFAVNHSFKDRVKCVDVSRKKIKYKDEDGVIITDPEMVKLGTKFFKSINDRNKYLIQKYLGELLSQPDFPEEIMTEMAAYMTMVNQGARGEKSSLGNEFVKGVCARTVT